MSVPSPDAKGGGFSLSIWGYIGIIPVIPQKFTHSLLFEGLRRDNPTYS